MTTPHERAGVLIVELGPAPDGMGQIRSKGQPGGWIAEGIGLSDTRTRIVRPWQGEVIPPIRHYGGVVFSGAAAMVTEPEEWHQRAFDWLDTAVEAGRAILGICYGHQLIGQVLRSEVGWNAKGREIGQVPVELTAAAVDDPLFNGLEGPLSVYTTHSQSVMTLPRGAVLLASNAHDPVQAFRWRDHVWGVQFHPEFSAKVMQGYIKAQRAALKEESRDLGALRSAVTTAGEDSKTILRNFGRLIR